jgi:hypothetical protein
MKKTLFLAALMAMSLGAAAQSITPQMLEKFKTDNALTKSNQKEIQRITQILN